MADAHEITDLLRAWSNGNAAALQEVIPLVDRELRRLAHAYMRRERAGHTLQTTALINEALMRLIDSEQIDWQSRVHFYSIVARRMRQVLIEHARSQLAVKRGQRGGTRYDFRRRPIVSRAITGTSNAGCGAEQTRRVGSAKSQVIEYRYFGGFSIEEVADILQVSSSTVQNDWRLARSWLRREILSETRAN